MLTCHSSPSALHSKLSGFQGCPVLGVGLGLRRPLHAETMQASAWVDWLEFTPENYMGRGGLSECWLQEAVTRFPLVSHGVSLSLGSVDPLNEVYLSQLEHLFAWVNPPWISDHLCFSSVDGAYFNDLLPLPRTREAILHVVRRIQQVQDRFQRPVLIENISQYVQCPDDEMSEADFVAAIAEKADCGLLLDVNNVYVNSINHGLDALDFLDQLPLQRVVQMHVAGHHEFPEGLVDTHGAPVAEPVWELLRWVLRRSRPCGVMLERDTYLPALETLIPELQHIRRIGEETGWLPGDRDLEEASSYVLA